MSGKVEFAREFRWRVDAASTRIYPKGWKGVVDSDVEEAAGAEGALVGVIGEDAAPLAGMTVAALKATAEAESIDLGDAVKKADIIAAIEAARAAKS